MAHFDRLNSSERYILEEAAEDGNEIVFKIPLNGGIEIFLSIQSFQSNLMKDLITMDTNVKKAVIISVCESTIRQRTNNISFRIQRLSSSSSSSNLGR